jgi:hypothetical protein
MKIFQRAKRAFVNPRLLARGFNRLYHRRGGRQSQNVPGVDIFDEDWDTLVVLDACRYDMFESTNELPGTLSSKISKGSSTVEWLEANFHIRDLRDTVYVTANPQLEKNRDRWEVSLHETINVWLENGWDEETGTVRAETMTEAALNVADRFPNKRLVVHYMQPHYPFVPAETEVDKKHLHQMDNKGGEPSEENIWNQKFNKKIDLSQKRIWSIYIDNLKYVLENVEKLFKDNFGKVVVTGDHGNYLGERSSPIPIKEWGHPRGIYDDPLVQVPWLEYEQGRRRQIHQDDNRSRNSIDDETVSDRLQALGYHEK